MKLEVTNHFTESGGEFFYWTLYDGADGADQVTGFGNDLCEDFSKVIEWRHRIAKDYFNNNNTENETHL